jgi:hypothetical protein
MHRRRRQLLVAGSTDELLNLIRSDDVAGVARALHEPSPHHDFVIMHAGAARARRALIQLVAATGAAATVVRNLLRLGATAIVDCSLRLVGTAPTRARKKGLLALVAGYGGVFLD